MDGATNGNSNLATTGGTLCFDDGNFIKGFTHYLGENIINSFAKAMAMVFDILMNLIWVSLLLWQEVTHLW